MSDPVRDLGLVSGGCQTAAARGSQGPDPLRRDGDPRPIPLHGHHRSAGAAGLRTMAGARYGWPDGVPVPLARLRRVRAAAGAGRRLSHRCPHSGGAVHLRGSDPAGGGTAPDLLQQLQPRVPHQRAGRGGIRQRPGGPVALADPRLRRPPHRAAVPGTGPGTKNRSPRHFLSGPLSASGLCVIRPGQRRDHALRLRLRHVLLCADLAPDGPPRPMGGPDRGLRGVVLPDAPPDL